jgi:Xaa-Pro aminopeptidase
MGPDAVALLIGAQMVTRSGDTHYPFRQNSDFWYLTGFDHPQAAAVLRTDSGPPFTLFVQPREREAETWNGYRPGTEGAKRDHGADEAFDIAELPGKIPSIVAKAKRVFHVLGRDADLDRRLIEALENLRGRSRMGFEPASEIVDPRNIIHEMRLFKDEEELRLMRRAAEITCEAHRQAAALAQPGCSERELEAMLDYNFRLLGGSGPAYSSIVAGGANATILHYVKNDQPLGDGELLLIDAGAEYRGYASDVTRTYPVGGRFQGARREVYETVLAAQTEALEACRPGTTLDAIHQVALRKLVEGMLDLGLLQGERDQLIAEEAYRPFYLHRTSHWLGRDVHDVGVYARDGEPRPLEPGMVFSVEPGIYVPHDQEQAPARLRGIGVRIEDDVLIRPDGHENLSTAIPKKPGEVEAWVNGD